MPICSMTGYGQHQSQNSNWELSVRLKTLNHRYLDLRLSGLEPYPALELRVRDLFQRSFARGRVDLEVELRRASQAPTLRFDLELARRYWEELAQLQRELGLRRGPSLEFLLGLEGVTQREVCEEEGLWPLLESTLRHTIAQVQQMRAEEGARLEGELRAFLEAWKGLVEDIAGRAPQLKGLVRQRLKERLAALGNGLQLDESRLEEEVLLYAERGDISEELARLSSHFQAVEGALSSDEAAGKVLDFLAQEVGREVNTIGAKAKDAQISHDVIELKSLLEKFREQVRNIE